MKEVSFPNFEGDLFVSFDHVELMSFVIDCGKYVISVFSALCVFPKHFIIGFYRKQFKNRIFCDSCWGTRGFRVSGVFRGVLLRTGRIGKA